MWRFSTEPTVRVSLRMAAGGAELHTRSSRPDRFAALIVDSAPRNPRPTEAERLTS